MSQIKEKPNNGEENNSKNFLRALDGSVQLRNPFIPKMYQDTLYNMRLDNRTFHLNEMFGDVKFVCMGGTQGVMDNFSNYFQSLLRDFFEYDKIDYTITLRCAMYKVGPVLFVSNGIGTSSTSMILHEIIKLMYHAKMKNPIMFKIGMCGGLGLDCGTVVITEEVVDGMMQSYHETPILGKIVKRPAILDPMLVGELKSLSDEDDLYVTTSGKTMCASDFYEGQARIDGAFCDFTEENRNDYLTELHQQGVRNVEMQAIPFAAITHHAGIKAAIVCVTLMDKLKSDQVNASEEEIQKWRMRAQKLVACYIKRYLKINKRLTPYKY